MRIDQFLKKTSIIKKRNIAKIMCANNYIKLNGKFVKPSRPVKPGDLIEIDTPRGIRKILIQNIPVHNVKKSEQEDYYQEITEAR